MRKPNVLDRIPRDKLLHFVIGAVVQSLSMLLITPYLALLVTVLVGIGIEVYQKVTKTGKLEVMDAVSVILGGLLVLLSSFTIEL